MQQDPNYLNFFALSFVRLQDHLASLGISTTHALQLFRSVYKQNTPGEKAVSHLGKYIGPALLPHLAFELPTIASEHISAYDQSIKFVVTLTDGEKIEMVLMPESSRVTLCISSQVGCAQACSFCYTGKMGLRRNLSASEIVGQVVLANRYLDEKRPFGKDFKAITNLVFMGMGEPLDNFQELTQALDIILDVKGLSLAKRRVTVSTAGHLEGLKSLLSSHHDVGLALSVHSANPSLRSKLMPINRRFSLSDVLDYIRTSAKLKKRHIFVQYTMMQGINDKKEDADLLAQMLTGIPAKVNLIPMNPVSGTRFHSPEYQTLREFQDTLHHHGLRCMVRFSKGQDIAAACGQLIS